jgi:signal transduction histidine kinase
MSALRLFFTVLLVVFVVELGVMIVLPDVFPPDVDPRWESVPDAVLLTLLCAPVLWWLMSERRRAEAERKARAQQQAVAFDFGRRALVCEEVPRLLDEAVRCLADTLQAEFVGVWELLPEDESLLLRAGVGWRDGAVGQATWKVALQASAEGTPFPCSAFSEGKMHRHCGRCSPLLHEHGVQSGICVVIQGDRLPFGMIGVYTARQRAFTRDEVHFLQDIAIEITLAVERSQAEQRRRERETLRAEQMAMVAQLATGVAHEIRNPLTSVKMLIQANQEEGGERPLNREDLQIIEGEIRRMERCLQTFLDYARPPKPERKLIDLATLVQRTFALVKARAERHKVALCFEPSSEPFHVEADAGQIQQVLLNLALNGLDAMPQGGTLEAHLRKCDDQVELAVLDTGPGIAPSMRGRLFQPFATSKETGVGLGLVISRRIAEDHRGALSAQNRPAGGACFTLRLPCRSDTTAQ